MVGVVVAVLIPRTMIGPLCLRDMIAQVRIVHFGSKVVQSSSTHGGHSPFQPDAGTLARALLRRKARVWNVFRNMPRIEIFPHWQSSRMRLNLTYDGDVARN